MIPHTCTTHIQAGRHRVTGKNVLQAVGATTPAFTAVLSLVMLNKRETVCTYLALLPVVFGVVVSTKAELSFSTAGFAAAVAAAAARAFKSVLQVCV